MPFSKARELSSAMISSLVREQRRFEWRLRLGCVGVGRITWSKEMKGLRKVWGSDRYWSPEHLGRDA